MPLPELQPFQVPNFAANLQGLQTMKAQENEAKVGSAIAASKFELDKQKFVQEAEKFKAEKEDRTRKQVIEVNDYALNLLAGVNSPEDLEIAKSHFKLRYPQAGDLVDRMLPEYNPTNVRMIREELRTETQRLKLEEQEKEIKSYAPGSALYQGGKQIGSVPTKPETPDYELFTDGSGQQAYLTKGAKVPSGWKRAEKTGGGVTINMPKAAPAGERESLNKLFEFESQLSRIEEGYDPKYVGRVQGNAGALKELTGIGANEGESGFRQVVKDIGDTLLRLRSGAQINEQEYQRMLKLVPTADLPDTVFKARLKSLHTAIRNSIATRKGTMGESGFIVPSGTPEGEGGAEGEAGITIIKFDSQGNMIQ